jgi:hypothetical protein
MQIFIFIFCQITDIQGKGSVPDGKRHWQFLDVKFDWVFSHITLDGSKCIEIYWELKLLLSSDADRSI